MVMAICRCSVCRNMEQAWSALEQRKRRVTLVFREGEPLLAEMDDGRPITYLLMEFLRARCLRIPNGGHTLYTTVVGAEN